VQGLASSLRCIVSHEDFLSDGLRSHYPSAGVHGPDIGYQVSINEVDMNSHATVRLIALGLALFLAGCAGLSTESEKAEAKPVAQKKAPMPVVQDAVIVPGKRIGPVSVGMLVPQLYDVMGEPAQAVKMQGNERYKFEELEVTVDEVDQSVKMVSTASPAYATGEGLKVGVSELAVRARLAKLPGQLLIKVEGDTTTYLNTGMVIQVSGGQVRFISVRGAP
jgi:hypothetical protein